MTINKSYGSKKITEPSNIFTSKHDEEIQKWIMVYLFLVFPTIIFDSKKTKFGGQIFVCCQSSTLESNPKQVLSRFF